MQLVERHFIHQGDARYAALDAASFASKNLYNLANYHMRQTFIQTGKYLGYAEVYHLIKHTDAYQALPLDTPPAKARGILPSPRRLAHSHC